LRRGMMRLAPPLRYAHFPAAIFSCTVLDRFFCVPSPRTWFNP
jgi:hypothetical protein